MGSPSIRIAIQADDQSGAAIAQAQAKIQAFKAASESAGTGMATSMREARGSVMLLGEEIGVKMNRHVAGFVAALPGVGLALQGAFAPLAIFTFIEILQKAYEKVVKVHEVQADTKSFTAWRSECDKLTKSYQDLERQAELVGKTEEQKHLLRRQWAAEDQKNIQSYLNQLKAERDAQQAIIDNPPQKAFTMYTGAGAVTGSREDLEAASAATERVRVLTEAIHGAELQVFEAGLKRKEVDVKISEELEKQKKHLTDIATIMAEAFKLQDATRRGMYSLTAGQVPGAAQVGGLLLQGPQTHDLSDIQAEMQKSQNQQKWFEQTRTSAEKLDETLAQIKKDYAGVTDPAQLQVMQRAIDKANEGYFHTDQIMKQLGADIFQTFQQGILMGESFRNLMINLALEIGKAILQYELLKAAKKNADDQDSGSDSGGSGGGGLFGSILSGMFGMKASGGPVSMGSSYLVGESGPELFTPRSSGVITPNSALGGNNYYIDARGGDAQTEMRVMRAIAASENRAVARSVQAYQEVSLRR